MHTIDIVNDMMAVLDEDGNGCDCCQLRSLREAKRQLRRWQDQYVFPYAEAMNALSEYFAKASAPTTRKKTMPTEKTVIDRGMISDAIRDTLRRLPGIVSAYATTLGVVAETAEEDRIMIEVTMVCNTMPHRIDIIDDAMVVLDRDGKGCVLFELTNRSAAKRQLRKWQTDYTFDYEKALKGVEEFFDAQ